MKNIFSCIVIFSLLLTTSLFSQSGRTTGKIEGVVIDQENDEPLIGVNVVINNTLLGATTDLDGYYIILNVPAGTYTVEYSYVGYSTQRMTDVNVAANQTTKINILMEVEALEGEVVEVVAEKPIIQRDQTSTTLELNAEQMKRKPVTTFVSVLNNQLGAVRTEGASGGLHFRGGRSGELAYYVDGVNTNDPTYQGRGTTVDLNAIENMTVITGGFNAEYGEAMSGVVQLITKSGSNKNYNMFLEGQSNDFMSGRYDNGYIKYVGNLSGPIPLTKGRATFFVNGFKEDRKIDNPSHFYEIRNNDRQAEGYTFKMQTDPHPNVRFFISGNYNNDIWNLYNSAAHQRTKGYWIYEIPERSQESYLLSSSLTHMLSTKFFYDVTVSYFSTKYTLYGQGGKHYRDFQTINSQLPWVREATLNPHRTDPYFDQENFNWRLGMTEEEAWLDYYKSIGYCTEDGNGNISWIGLEQKIEAYDNRYLTTGYWDYNADSTDIVYIPFDIDGYRRWQRDRDNPDLQKYAFEGNIFRAMDVRDRFNYFYYGFQPWWHERTTNKFETEIAFQGQVNKHNFIKIGGKANFTDLEHTDIQFLNQNPYFDYYFKKPTLAAAYIQDKFEFEDMVINVGLRYDYFHPHSEVIKDVNDVEQGYKQATLKEQFSPRLGIAFAVSDKTTMRANYGKFFQVPDLGEIYQSIQVDFTSGVPLIGNPDLPPQKETMYAISLKHRLGFNASFEINGYYKDIEKLLSTRKYTTIWNQRPATYTIFQISDFAKVKGVEFVLEKRPSRFFYGSIAYSLMDAKGSGSSSREFYYRWAQLPNEQLPRKEYPLEFDITHSFKADINLYLPKNYGPPVLGFRPFQDIVASLFYYYYSGPPYTPVDKLGNPGDLGSKRMPSTNRTDLRIEKRISFGNRITMSLFTDIRNLFNTINVVEIWETTGKPDDNGYIPEYNEATYRALAEQWLYFNEDGEPDAIGYFNDQLARWKEYVKRPNYYGIPRIIRFGISANVSL